MQSAIKSEWLGETLRVSAPSNIALIKYMGLENAEEKLPANTSLSYTLEHARTLIEVKSACADKVDVPMGSARFLNFVKKLKAELLITESLSITSSNNFPTACGIASSAASFAGLTAALTLWSGKKIEQDMVYFSRLGSGSACRSFYTGFVEWQKYAVKPIALPFNDLRHAVILLDKSPKAISSSTAHKLVATSPLFKARIKNVESRLNELKIAISNKNWQEAGEIIKAEYLEMHALFSSANPSFNYRTSLCVEVERWCCDFVRLHGFGPWVTLDAGPNIHLIFRSNSEKQDFLTEFNNKYGHLEVYQ